MTSHYKTVACYMVSYSHRLLFFSQLCEIDLTESIMYTFRRTHTPTNITSTNFWNDDLVETSSNTFSARGKCSM